MSSGLTLLSRESSFRRMMPSDFAPTSTRTPSRRSTRMTVPVITSFSRSCCRERSNCLPMCQRLHLFFKQQPRRPSRWARGRRSAKAHRQSRLDRRTCRVRAAAGERAYAAVSAIAETGAVGATATGWAGAGSSVAAAPAAAVEETGIALCAGLALLMAVYPLRCDDRICLFLNHLVRHMTIHSSQRGAYSG